MCATVYATQIVTWHGTGYKLITDNGRAFLSSLFKETCKILGIRKVHISSYHPASNGMTEPWHRSLHTARSHYINPPHKLGRTGTILSYGLRATPKRPLATAPFISCMGKRWHYPVGII